MNKDITRVKLITATAPASALAATRIRKRRILKGQCILLRCATASTATIRMPATTKINCSSRRPAGKRKTCAVGCHQTGLHVAEKGSRHAALDMGCDTCHVTHKTGADPSEENKFHLAKASLRAVPGLPRCQGRGASRTRKQPAVRHGQLRTVPRSASVGFAEADGKVPAAPFQGNGCDTCHRRPRMEKWY